MEIRTDWLCRPSAEDEGGLGLSKKAYLEMASCEKILDSTCVGSIEEIKIASKSERSLQPKCRAQGESKQGWNCSSLFAMQSGFYYLQSEITRGSICFWWTDMLQLIWKKPDH